MTKLKEPMGIAIDGIDNIYTANETYNWITVYTAGSTGNVPPMNTIKGKKTGLNIPLGIAVR